MTALSTTQTMSPGAPRQPLTVRWRKPRIAPRAGASAILVRPESHLWTAAIVEPPSSRQPTVRATMAAVTVGEASMIGLVGEASMLWNKARSAVAVRWIRSWVMVQIHRDRVWRLMAWADDGASAVEWHQSRNLSRRLDDDRLWLVCRRKPYKRFSKNSPASASPAT